MQLPRVIIIPAVALCLAAAERPSGFDVWQTCHDDIRTVCPGKGILNLGELKSCMRVNFSQLGARCQTIIRLYETARRDETHP